MRKYFKMKNDTKHMNISETKVRQKGEVGLGSPLGRCIPSRHLMLTDSSLLIRFNDSNSLDELTELNDKMCDDEIQGEETSEPCLARKRRKETERSSYALSPKPRKLVAHRVNVWEFFIQKEDDPTQNNCCLCEFLEADESST
ncbi:LOW QUALITY PROTEIN: hypothetical protein HID58_009865 [Brassica napus]|uniref:Uncharacterized protein n=1 Tax=Brassica napus TaxID=3708 RepID=A0ABQ8DU20_BRANA|nr:LOW QUALITY PROTEIN: hypothetical protein HID58_009865 [Brassica napus]